MSHFDDDFSDEESSDSSDDGLSLNIGSCDEESLEAVEVPRSRVEAVGRHIFLNVSAAVGEALAADHFRVGAFGTESSCLAHKDCGK